MIHFFSYLLSTSSLAVLHWHISLGTNPPTISRVASESTFWAAPNWWPFQPTIDDFQGSAVHTTLHSAWLRTWQEQQRSAIPTNTQVTSTQQWRHGSHGSKLYNNKTHLQQQLSLHDLQNITSIGWSTYNLVFSSHWLTSCGKWWLPQEGRLDLGKKKVEGKKSWRRYKNGSISNQVIIISSFHHHRVSRRKKVDGKKNEDPPSSYHQIGPLFSSLLPIFYTFLPFPPESLQYQTLLS